MELSTEHPASSFHCTEEYARLGWADDKGYTPVSQEQLTPIIHEFLQMATTAGVKFKKRVLGVIEGYGAPATKLFYLGRGIVSVVSDKAIILTHETPGELEELAKELKLPKPNLL